MKKIIHVVSAWGVIGAGLLAIPGALVFGEWGILCALGACAMFFFLAMFTEER